MIFGFEKQIETDASVMSWFLQSVCGILITFLSSSCCVWEHRPVHAVSSRLWQREGPGKEQEVHFWHSSRSQQHYRGGHGSEPHSRERYAETVGAYCVCPCENVDVLVYVFVCLFFGPHVDPFLCAFQRYLKHFKL